MNDDRILQFERDLWVGDGDVYRERVSPDVVMVVPAEPFLLRGQQAIDAVEHTPRWEEVEITDLSVDRAQEGLIVIGYRADASRGEERFTAYCTSTYQRIGEHQWHVIQHQQTVPAAV